MNEVEKEKLVNLLLDDDYGVSKESYNKLVELGMVSEELSLKVEAVDGRFFIYHYELE